MEPYRRRLVALPLQRSLFREIGRAGEVLGLTDVLPAGRFRAWLDEQGDLYLDRSDVERLAAALPGRLAPDHLAAMEQAHQAACAGILQTSDQAACRAGVLDDAAARALLDELGGRIAALIPYGILSKFVPDVLYRALVAAGDECPCPFPGRSAGAELTDAALVLYLLCLDLDYPPERLEAEWPAVSLAVAAAVRSFCARHAGFGPLAWDAPGYEDPRYVFRVMRAAFAETDPDELRWRHSQTVCYAFAADPASCVEPPSSQGLEFVAPVAVPDGSATSALRRVLAFWLEFLERETWYVRRAFYVGIVPLLRRLAAGDLGRLLQPEDLLFLEIEELTGHGGEPAVVHVRRQRYLADPVYLTRQGIEPGRLTAILEGP